MTLSSQGRSVAALAGALSGQRDCDPGIGDAHRPRSARLRRSRSAPAISSQLTDDARLRQLVDPVLAAGRAASLPRAQIPFSIRDGRLRVGATTLEAARRPRHHLGRLRFPGRSGRHPRQSRLDRGERAERALPENPAVSRSGPPDSLNRSIDVAAPCRPGSRCGPSIARRGGWIRSNAACRSRRRPATGAAPRRPLRCRRGRGP